MPAEDVLRAAAEAVDPDEVVRIARALIAAPSENPPGDEEGPAAVATDVLASLDADPTLVRSDEGRPNVVAELGAGEGPSLAWNGHLDVVPAGDPATWTRDPWSGTVDAGRLVGRGSVDMKGGIAAALAAATALRRAGIGLAGSLAFHLVADEEVGGLHGTRVLFERGLLTQDACIVGEPSELQLGLAQRGGAWMTATARGKAAHGSQPQRGVNAITSMARFLLRLPEVLPDREHALVGRPTVNAALISGGSGPNVVPDRCVVDIDRRILPGEADAEAVREPFLELAARLRIDHPEVDVDVELREWTDAAEASGDAAIARVARDAVAAETGRRPDDVGFTGITDARFYLNDASIPGVILGPGSLSLAHTANESVPVDELVAAARIYARIFVASCGAA
jgi:acetylornithine deacetylase/succinyl-diaminopimelate desuccinylase family protein